MTASPELDIPPSGTGPVPYANEVMAGKVMTLEPVVILKVCLTGSAAEADTVPDTRPPGWVALMVTEPSPVIEREFPVTVAGPLSTVKETGRPELEVATNE